MKTEYIVDAFTKASKSIITGYLNLPVESGQYFKRGSTFKTQDILIVIGMVGDIKGQIAIGIPYDLGLRMASILCQNMEFDELNDIVKSALSELGNMILGTTATFLSQQNIRVDITPPTLLTGTEVKLASGELDIVCVPLSVGANILECDIGIKVE